MEWKSIHPRPQPPMFCLGRQSNSDLRFASTALGTACMKPIAGTISCLLRAGNQSQSLQIANVSCPSVDWLHLPCRLQPAPASRSPSTRTPHPLAVSVPCPPRSYLYNCGILVAANMLANWLTAWLAVAPCALVDLWQFGCELQTASAARAARDGYLPLGKWRERAWQ